MAVSNYLDGGCSSSSSTLSGPFKATEFFETLVCHLRQCLVQRVCRPRWRGGGGGGGAAFCGTELVDEVYRYLTSGECSFRNPDISRDNALRLAQVLMDYQVFKVVSTSRSSSKFVDSKSALYQFVESSEEGGEILLPGEVSGGGFPVTPISSRTRSGSLSATPSKRAGGGAGTSGERYQVTREVALAKLLTLIDLPFLDGLLSYSADVGCGDVGAGGAGGVAGVDRSSHPALYHSLQLHHTLLLSPPSPSQPTGEYTPADTGALYRSILAHYGTAPGEPVVGEEMGAVYAEVARLLLLGKDELAAQATQMAQLLLCRRHHLTLSHLIRFITAADAGDVALCAEDDSGDNEVNEDGAQSYLIQRLAPAIFPPHMMAEQQARRLHHFICAHWGQVSAVPPAVHREVSVRMKIRDACPIIGNHFCERVGSAEFERQRAHGSESALRQLAEAVLGDPTTSARHKRDFLRRLHKAHPAVYDKYYA